MVEDEDEDDDLDDEPIPDTPPTQTTRRVLKKRSKGKQLEREMREMEEELARSTDEEEVRLRF